MLFQTCSKFHPSKIDENKFRNRSHHWASVVHNSAVAAQDVITPARALMVIDDADGLQKAVYDNRTDKFEALFFHVFRHFV